MKALFAIILSLFNSRTREKYTWNGVYTVNDLSRIIRQYLFVFNTLCIERKERIAIIAPNSQAWIFLLIVAMAKRFKIYIISPRESLLNIRTILVSNSISHVFTNEDIGIKLKEAGMSRFTFFKSITEIGTIYNKSLVGTNSLFFSKYYSILNTTTEENDRIEKIKLASQYQEMDDQKLIDWATQLVNEIDLYEISVFSEGTTRNFLTKHTFNGQVFERIIEKIRILVGCRTCSVNLEIDYSEWVPFAVAFFIESASFKRNKADTSIFDNNTFLQMWREVVESKLQSPILNWLVNTFPFVMTYVTKKALLQHLGKFDDIFILNGGMLPIYIKRVLVKTKLPIYTTFGTLGNGYISYVNYGEEILSDLGNPVTENKGTVEIVFPYKTLVGSKPFYLVSSTDSIQQSNYQRKADWDSLYERTFIRPKILWFKQKALVLSKYEGRYQDTLFIWKNQKYTPMSTTILINLLKSVRLFNGVVIVGTPDTPLLDLRVLIEINQREKELLGLEGTALNSKVNSIISKLNKYLPKELRIHAFSLVEEGSFTKTRNGNVKSFLYPVK